MTERAAVEARGLRKAFRGRVAVDDLHLEVPQGEVFGFLGPNGAGKTTTVKMLLGLTAPTRGQAWLLGRPAGDASARRAVGYLPELFRFHDWLTGRELLRFHGQLYGLAGAGLNARVEEVLDLVGLAGRGDERVRSYSKGMQQRVGLAQALVNRPRVVFLDEPTSALDPLGRRDVRGMIARLKRDGVTVFLNTHLLEEAEHTCDRVAIVHRGRVVRSGPTRDLLEARLEAVVRVDSVTPRLLDAVRAHARVAASDERTLTVELGGEDDLPRVAAAVVGAGAALFELAPRRSSLEDVFVQLVEDGP